MGTSSTLTAAATALPISGQQLENAADFAEYMLRRRPEQLGVTPERFSHAQRQRLRVMLEAVYVPALWLAGRTDEALNPPGRVWWR